MKLHRFIGDFDLNKKQLEITNNEIIKQIKLVLRLEIGDILILCDGKGQEAEVKILEMTKSAIVVEILKQSVVTDHTETKKVNLYLAILKKENFELAVQKAVECGVNSIIPILTERTIKTGLNTERLEKIIREASEQSGRNILPTISPILKFEDAIKNIGQTCGIIFDLNGEEYKPNQGTKDFSIFIGPEGGFTEKEINQAREAGILVCLLGTNTLRAETAAIVATYRAVQGI